MNRAMILDKYSNDVDRLFVAKLLDKITLVKTRNQIVSTDFLDMYQKKISEEILKMSGEENYTYYFVCKGAEKALLIIYPDKYKELIEENRFNYSQFVKVIRIALTNELKNTYSHRDYLSGIMKLGIKREKVGDILVFDDGADIVVRPEICEFIINNLQQLTRFSKSRIFEIDEKSIREPEIKTQEIRIVVQSMRLDAIIAELANCSRNNASEIIENQRVFVNYENEVRNTKIVNEDDVIVIRGKGKFLIKQIYGTTKKGKIAINVEHYI